MVAISLLAPHVALIAALIALFVGVLGAVVNSYQIHKDSKRARLMDIDNRLSKIYGPLNTYLNTLKVLHQVLVMGKPDGFRTLTHLVNPKTQYVQNGKKVMVTLSAADYSLIDSIIDIEKKVEELVLANSGLIDEPSLALNYVPDPRFTDIELGYETSLLALALVHFRLLDLVRHNSANLVFSDEALSAYVYPRELNVKLQAKIRDLTSEREELLRTPWSLWMEFNDSHPAS
ncbi:MAG: hypothetical protein RIE53_02510 [Rhodothermales bacterium]